MKSLAALLAGGLITLGFSPFDWWPLMLPGFGILFGLWAKASARQAMWYGFMFGLGLFGSGISWMYISLHTYGDMPAILAAISIFGLVVFMSMYTALAGLLQAWFGHKTLVVRLVFIMPLSWLLLEWLRGWLFTGLPWLTTGYILLDSPLSGFVPIGGVYGLTLLGLMTIGTLSALLVRESRTCFLFLILFSAIWVSGWWLQRFEWILPDGEPIKVAMIQNNVPLSMKWDPDRNAGIVNDYLAESRKLQGFDLIVWPEAAVPDYLDRSGITLWPQLRALNTDIVFGTLERMGEGNQWQYYNSVAAFSGGNTALMYRKQHLVPFGEFFPLKFILDPILKFLNIPMANFSSWQEAQQPLPLAGSYAAMSVCFEDAFPNESRSQIPQSGLMINVSEDAWFGDSLAPHQRLQMARFRSLESGRPMIRSSNSGLSSLIDERGNVTTIGPQFERAVVSGVVQPFRGVTPYIRHGDQAVMLLAGGLFLLAILFGSRRRRFGG